MVDVIIYLPGIMGSNLIDLDTGNTVWPPTSTGDVLVLSNLSKSLEPSEPFQFALFGNTVYEHYKGVKKFFKSMGFAIREKKTGWESTPGEPTEKYFFDFPYDWRKSALVNAARLKDFIDNKVKAEFGSSVRIHMISHSAGGLVSRAYLWKYGNTNIKTQFLLGVPNHGAPKVYATLKVGESDMPILELFSTFKIRPVGDIIEQSILALSIMPGMYELLPSENYQQYFSDYGVLATYGTLKEETIKGTYIASNSTIITSPAVAEEIVTLNNDALVSNALKFHRDIGRSTFLPSHTYALYSMRQSTITGIRFLVNSRQGLVLRQELGDGTVPPKSSYDLEGLVTNDAAKRPILPYAVGIENVSHSGIRDHPIVLGYIIAIINYHIAGVLS